MSNSELKEMEGSASSQNLAGTPKKIVHISLVSVAVFFIVFGIGTAAAVLGKGGFWIMPSLIIAFFLAAAVKVASQWERVIILRLGRYHRTKGPGVFFIIPIIDTIPYWIDLRVFTAIFQAEQTLTKDNVPVNVDAVLFWRVVDTKKAALDVEDYATAVNWAAQTALRDIIGKSLLSDMLVGREKIDADLMALIHNRINPWGTEVQAVEIRDVIIPQGLQDAMSMQAQAERERQARIILGDSERQIAHSFEEAAKTYTDNPTALHLRAMNMLYEGLKGGQSTIVLVPSTAIDTMNLGAVAGLTTMAKEFGVKPKKPE